MSAFGGKADMSDLLEDGWQSPPAARQKKFGVNPGGLLNVNSFPDLGGQPVGYANFRKGTQPNCFYFLMQLARISGASLRRRRAEDDSPALDLFERCADVLSERAELGVPLGGVGVDRDRLALEQPPREKQ